MFGALVLLCTLQTSPRTGLGAALLAPHSFCCMKRGRGSKEALPNGAGVYRAGEGLSGHRVSCGAAGRPRAAAAALPGARWALASTRWVAAPATAMPSCPGTELPVESGHHRGFVPHLLWGMGQVWTQTSHLNFTRCLDRILKDLGLE